ncbi:hypothetical protein [Thermopirellula anaerolimosa]
MTREPRTAYLRAFCLAGLVGLGMGLASFGIAEETSPTGAAFAVRALYAPGHFGNSYEVMGTNEMRRLLAEARAWGFNRYGDWFDMEDCSDPFARNNLYQLAHAMWERKKANYQAAQSLGFACDLIITPNHVYVDQCREDLAAVQGGRIFGQLICPSNPEARRIILADYEDLFRDFAAAGVRLSAVVTAPYDFGGCGCDRCRPWILTFAQLSQEIHAVAERYHPGVELHMIGWWWEPEEHRMFAEWADEHMPGGVRRMYLHIPYGNTVTADVPLPRGCERSAFVHIGYADQAQPRDVYGHFGPVVAPNRLEKTVRDLVASGCTGVMAYSEGVFDDVNKALLAGLGSGEYASADEVLKAYARRYFGAEEATAAAWADWLRPWGLPFQRDADQAARTVPPAKRPSDDPWRLEQWLRKSELFSLHTQIAAENDWTPARLALVDRFWDAQERLQREVWGLGQLRHIFARKYTPLPWYASWAKHQAQQAATAADQQ